MKFDAKTWTASPQEMGEVARYAERLGFAGLWNDETKHDPYLCLVLATQSTERIDLGISIALAFPRSPTVAAHSSWDLQQLSKGRFILGLGTQVKAHITRRFGMTWAPPAARMREYVQAMRQVWECWQNGRPPDFKGQYYTVTLMNHMFNPGPIPYRMPPVYVAGAGPLMVRLAGELADGLAVHPLNSARYLKDSVLPGIREGAARTGRDPKSVIIASSVFAITGRTKAEKAEERKAVRRWIAFYASTPTYRPSMLDPYGWGEINPRLNQLAKEGKWEEMERVIPEDMEREVAVTGDWDELVPQLRQRYEGLVDRIHLMKDFRPGDMSAFWETLAKSARP